jgi:hypothetical protein
VADVIRPDDALETLEITPRQRGVGAPHNGHVLLLDFLPFRSARTTQQRDGARSDETPDEIWNTHEGTPRPGCDFEMMVCGQMVSQPTT